MTLNNFIYAPAENYYFYYIIIVIRINNNEINIYTMEFVKSSSIVLRSN